MGKIVAYITGTLALLIVIVSIGAALVSAVLHSTETLQNLATSTLQGVGVAIGGVLGGALILRFRSARKFLADVVKDIK